MVIFPINPGLQLIILLGDDVMKVIEPGFHILHNDLDNPENLKRLEKIARVCYQSKRQEITDAKDDQDATNKFLAVLAINSHYSIFEHLYCTVLFTIDRGLTHELVRHRIASFAQESTRYCNYSKGTFDNEITVIKPHFLNEGTVAYNAWYNAMKVCEHSYFTMLQEHYTPEEARCVLPNSLKADLVVTANLREWKHILELRAARSAHPQMQKIMLPLFHMFTNQMPYLFVSYTSAECEP